MKLLLLVCLMLAANCCLPASGADVDDLMRQQQRNYDYHDYRTEKPREEIQVEIHEGHALYFRMQCFECYTGDCTKPRRNMCPAERPRCATRAFSPDFKSQLTCSAAIPGTCNLLYAYPHYYEMVCSCLGNMCNKVFDKSTTQQLTNFALLEVHTNNSRLTDIFLRMAHSVNTTHPHVYEIVTGQFVTTIAPTIALTSAATVGTEAPPHEVVSAAAAPIITIASVNYIFATGSVILFFKQ